MARLRPRRTGTGLPSARLRFERRAAATRRRPKVLAGLAVGLAALVAGLVWLGWFSTLLTADAVEVRGVPAAQAAHVRGVAAVPLGGPLLRVDTGSAEARLVAGREWREVRVSRSLPHTVVVEVVPRTAVLAVRQANGRIEVVDREGFAFRAVTSVPKGVPLVNAGSRVTASGVTAALQAIGSLAPSLRSGISSVTVSSADQVTFDLTHAGTRRTVVWGGPGDPALKARLVTILLGQPGETIDVSVPSSPVTR